MDDIEVPNYFICPISLQIMRDPVTATTGITYDRESIEHWLFEANNTTCPVSKQPLPRDSTLLTPNHALLRLIQSWPSQKPIASPEPRLLNLITDLSLPKLQLTTLRKLELFAVEHERNKNYALEAGHLAKAMWLFITACYERGETMGLDQALNILYLVRNTSIETNLLLSENNQITDAITWVLGQSNIDNYGTMKSHALLVLKTIIRKVSSKILEGLKPEFFQRIVIVLRDGIEVNSALHVMLETCPWGRNKMKMAEAGAVFELIELELGCPDRRTTEICLGILSHLCCCADGRAQFLSHAASIAMITKRILKVSPAADHRSVSILSLICRFSGTDPVLQEMVRVGTVTALCMVLQVECATCLKDKAKEILRAHSQVWKSSPCIEISTLLSNYSRISDSEVEIS